MVTPEAVDRDLEASLKRVLGRSLVCNEIAIYDERHGFDSEPSFEVLSASPAAKAEARMLANAALLPAGEALAVKELMRLKLLTKARSDDSATLEARLAVFGEELAAYPADVVIDACRWWSRAETFFPSWSELKDLLDRRVKRRKRLRAALAEV